jgi:hypothetical protein
VPELVPAARLALLDEVDELRGEEEGGELSPDAELGLEVAENVPEVDMEEPSVPLQHQVVIVSGGGQALNITLLARFLNCQQSKLWQSSPDSRQQLTSRVSYITVDSATAESQSIACTSRCISS